MKEYKQSGGIGFSGALTVLFVGLKLTGHINWSWWLVISPSLIPAAMVVLAVVVAAIAKALD